jgi:hypothetical protein
MVAMYGEVNSDWPKWLRMLLPMPMKGGLKTVADETGSVPMERRSMGIPS